jgi:phosphohistidine swiveling domain-containing protein
MRPLPIPSGIIVSILLKTSMAAGTDPVFKKGLSHYNKIIMNLPLSKPEYYIDKDELAKDGAFIKDQQNVRLIRRRVPFFMDGYRYAAAAVKERWGIDFTFFEAGHEQVKPCYLPGALDKKGGEIWWQKINDDENFADSLAKELLTIIDLEKTLAASIPDRSLSPKEIQKILLAHLDWWTKYFEIGFLWFGVEYIKEKIDEEIKTVWTGTPAELKEFIDEAYRPMKLPVSSVEQRDLLAICRLKEESLETALKEHSKKYHHLSLHNIDDEFFDLDYYRERIRMLANDEEYSKTKQALETADRELVRANEIIKNAKLSDDIKKQINFVRWFMYLRTESIDHMMLVNGAYKPVFASLATIFSLPMDAVLHMTYEEIIYSLKKGELSVSRDLILDRTRNGYAFLIATPPHKSYFVVGKEADELNKFVVPEGKNSDIKEIKGQTAFKGKVRGIARVILDRRNANELKAGEILVTTMTSPDFVPAMKLSAGIITNEGGILCHAAIMSRELGRPCLIGAKIATDVIKTGQMIILDADAGVITIE